MKVPLLTALLLSPLSSLALSTPVPIFTLPGPVQPASWFENMAVRPNGRILATRGDAPEIWQIDPATGEGALLVSVAGAFNLTGIAEVFPHLETYVFGSSHIPAPLQIEPGSAKVWTLQFPREAPTVSLLAAMPSAGFINGIAAFGTGRVLLGDTVAEAVYLMDVGTAAYTTPLTGLAGINGIKATVAAAAGPPGYGYGYGYVYWADHLSATLSRIPVGADDVVATGPAEVLAANQSIDDFAIVVGASGRGRAYIAAMYDVEVVEVVFGPAPSSGPGVKRVVAENLSGTGMGISTAVAFGRRPQDSGLLYVTVGQGGGSAAIVRVDPTE
ncbi:hypothetical protein N658DRAFT_431286 [Parathielavia hyrcaniae]|uniref:Uncharacterized protein n=1 Tax=Parathielavia hyrcaniae TaxID=113614 RepID=A0AAN6PVN1_9PEZI|nr:hypothetical protein N658DRAFT_431286 [Parathielavia hyrcaniae]